MTNFNFNNIPNELKDLNQWVTWKTMNRDNDKLAKVPYNPVTGIPTNPSKQLYSYTEACQYAEEFPENVTGIGFYFNGNGISGIDIDNCIDESGTLNQDARNIIDRLNSYTEYSPSGKGIHIIFKGQLHSDSRNKNGHYEVYSDKRYFTVTGNILENKTTLESRQEELEWFYNEYISKSAEDDADKIVKIICNSKNADKFNRLMGGNISDYNHDESRADQALMCILAFYCKKDSYLMEQVFNKSKLAQRDKWKDRKDYREGTIQYAIKHTGEVIGNGNNSESKKQISSRDEQLSAANSVLEEFDNPCDTFDIQKLPPLMKRYVNHICNTTDADPIIVANSFIGMMSGILKKSVYIPEVDSDKKPHECYFERLYPNVYFINVMQSGSFKTTALNNGFKLAYNLEKLKSSSNISRKQSIFLPQKSTVEALLKDVQELDGGVINLSEFGSWLQEMDKNYNGGLKAMFTNFYDVPPRYCHSTKGEGRIEIERPFISIIAVSTIDWVKDNINIKDVNTGFFARFLIFNPRGKSSIPPALPVRKHIADTTIENEILDIINKKIPETPREYSLSMDAYDRFNDIHTILYEHFYKLSKNKQRCFEPFIKRWSPYILKIAMIMQFMIDPDTNIIGVDGINSAYEIVKYAIKSTNYLFKRELGESKHDADCRKVLEFIAKRTERGQETKWKHILQSHILPGGVKEYKPVIEDLMESDKIRRLPGEDKKNDLYYLTTGGGEEG